jgi:hypothetical protein
MLYDKQTYDSKLLSHHKYYGIFYSQKTHSNIRKKLRYCD